MTRLNETIAWCARHGSIDAPQTSLRQFPKETWSDLEDRDGRVRTVTDSRSERLRSLRHLHSAMPPDTLGGGRLMAYLPDGNMSDGYAEHVTDGWFDVNNIPPHDTWIELVVGSDRPRDLNGYLLSWVPVEFVPLVGKGIAGNPEQCILWARNHDHPLTNALRARGLTG